MMKEVSENDSGQHNGNQVGNAEKRLCTGREIPQRAAALDSRWRTRAMLDH